MTEIHAKPFTDEELDRQRRITDMVIVLSESERYAEHSEDARFLATIDKRDCELRATREVCDMADMLVRHAFVDSSDKDRSLHFMALMATLAKYRKEFPI
jgi:hypothetical protein